MIDIDKMGEQRVHRQGKEREGKGRRGAVASCLVKLVR